MDLYEYFDRVAVINLKRRSDRWERFQQALSAVDWPFREPERVPAVDGDAVSVPVWWKQGGGAWGCLMSHVRILEDCLRDGVERVLIVEDDAVFVEDLREKAAVFLEHVPGGWDQLYLGGQHLRDPIRINEHVYRCVNVNRTHCHAVNRGFMSRMYRWILNAQDYIAHPGHHIDHRLGALQETDEVNAFSPIRWFAGQGENQSDISGRINQTYFWNTWADVPSMPMTVVLSLHEAHAHRLGGLLKDMGVHFGHRLGGYQQPYVEDEGLAQICERALPFPQTEKKLGTAECAALLRDWCRVILREAADYGVAGAASYPHLCAMYREFASAWPNLRVIEIRCDFQDAVENLKRRSLHENGWLGVSSEACEKVQRFLEDAKAEWLQQCDHLSVEADELVRDPQEVSRAIREFLGAGFSHSAFQTGGSEPM